MTDNLLNKLNSLPRNCWGEKCQPKHVVRAFSELKFGIRHALIKDGFSEEWSECLDVLVCLARFVDENRDELMFRLSDQKMKLVNLDQMKRIFYKDGATEYNRAIDDIKSEYGDLYVLTKEGDQK